MIFDIGVEQYIIREQRMRLLRAYSIVVVHGISGPKTWVRFPVCSFFTYVQIQKKNTIALNFNF